MMDSLEPQVNKCDFCMVEVDTTSDLKTHYQICHKIGLQQCKFCDAEFAFTSELDRHLKKKHTDNEHKRHECERCSSSFKSVKSLKYHIKTRHINRQEIHKCDECGITFQYKSSYAKHMRIRHESLTYIKCDLCPKIFNQKQTLKRHKEVEHSENFERAQCKLCPASYKYKEYLHTHMKKKHFSNARLDLCDPDTLTEERKHRCHVCGVNFKKKVFLLTHQKKYHNRKVEVFQCEKCPTAFTTRDSYHFHMNKIHGIDKCSIKKEDEFYINSDIDFESVLMNDIEFKQLLMFKKRKCNQNKSMVIVDYEASESDEEIEIDDDEVDVIRRNMKEFFSVLISSSKKIPNEGEIGSSSGGEKIEKNGRRNNRSTCDSEKVIPQKESDPNTNLISHNDSANSLDLDCSLTDEMQKNIMTVIPEENIPKQDNSAPQNIGENVIENVVPLITETVTTDVSVREPSHRNLKKSLNKTKKSISPSTYKCATCNRDFKLKAHLASHNKRCKRNNESVKNVDINLQEHMFQCVECNILFPDEDLLKQHQLWEHEIYVTLHKCCQCALLFNQLGDLQHHMETKHSKVF